MVLPIGPPHTQSRLTSESRIRNLSRTLCGLFSTSGWLSISRSRSSCRGFRSFLLGVLLQSPECRGVVGIVFAFSSLAGRVGFCSSPPRVMARSLPFFPMLFMSSGGAELEVGKAFEVKLDLLSTLDILEGTVDPPSSISSSAHSQVIANLDRNWVIEVVMVRIWALGGIVVALDLERRLVVTKTVGDVGRGGTAGVIGRDSAQRMVWIASISEQ
jgi:hypothetical protein